MQQVQVYIEKIRPPLSGMRHVGRPDFFEQSPRHDQFPCPCAALRAWRACTRARSAATPESAFVFYHVSCWSFSFMTATCWFRSVISISRFSELLLQT